MLCEPCGVSPCGTPPLTPYSSRLVHRKVEKEGRGTGLVWLAYNNDITGKRI